MAFGGGLEQTSTYQASPRDLVDFEVTDIELGIIPDKQEIGQILMVVWLNT